MLGLFAIAFGITQPSLPALITGLVLLALCFFGSSARAIADARLRSTAVLQLLIPGSGDPQMW